MLVCACAGRKYSVNGIILQALGKGKAYRQVIASKTQLVIYVDVGRNTKITDYLD
jgi:hypothetical protein